MVVKTCPGCGNKGRSVDPLTIASLAPKTVLSRLPTRDGFCYCPTLDCPVAWFHPQNGEVVDKTELKVRIGMKETSGPRPICYCFDHDAAQFEADVQRQGRSLLPTEIAAKCKAGLSRCREMNPQGSCCLGNVNLVIQTALAKKGPKSPGFQPFKIIDP